MIYVFYQKSSFNLNNKKENWLPELKWFDNLSIKKIKLDPSIKNILKEYKKIKIKIS